MTQLELIKLEVTELYDLLADTMNQLFTLENSPANELVIREKKERLLILQNVITLKKLDNNNCRNQ